MGQDLAAIIKALTGLLREFGVYDTGTFAYTVGNNAISAQAEKALLTVLAFAEANFQLDEESK